MASEKQDGVLIPRAAYAVFALLMVAAPLLFGATDRFFQAFLLAAFALGLYLAPPLLWPVGSRAWMIGLAALGFLVFKEFAPSALFGSTGWRRTLVANYGVDLPWTHHPEPVRALEGLLSGLMGVLWFFWVRTLARRQDGAARVLWILLGSGVAVSAVSLYFGTAESAVIYGIREMPGYKGFGPFPNRNHTACFLAMSTVVGLGVLFQSLRRKKIPDAVFALAGLLLSMVVLLETKSRGGLLALGAGAAVFGFLLFLRSPGRKALATLAAAVLIGLTVFFLYGKPLLVRMTDLQGLEGDLRWTVWQDAKAMWLAAPLFGHGLGSFGSVFPMFQSITSGNTLVLHPESSWLQWLTELGLIFTFIAVLGGLGGLGWTLVRPGHGVSGGTLRAAGAGAVVVLLVHSIYDVPAHRWATAAFALAALGAACPARDDRERLARPWALLPAGVAALWLVPLLTLRPLWNTGALNQALAENYTSTRVSGKVLARLAEYFPLDPDLQHALGVRRLINRGSPAEAWRRFRIADRLKPASFLMPASQAVLAGPVSREMTYHLWTVAIDRAGHRAEDIFLLAWERTRAYPDADRFWRQYAGANPQFLLSYARVAEPSDTAGLLREWRQRRRTDFQPFEVINFYTYLPRAGSVEMLESWMRENPGRQATDARRWARIALDFGRAEEAWQMLADLSPEPGFGEKEPAHNLASLEVEWREAPENFLKARRLAGALEQAGDAAMRDQVILATAAREGAPAWFLERAAHLYARERKYDQAVEALLRIKVAQ